MMFNVLLRGACCAAAIGCIFVLPAGAATITVTPATFDSAVATVRGGDTIALVGTFGKIRVINKDFASTVTINASRATFTDTVTINNVENLSFGGGTFNIVGAPQFTHAVAVYGGRNISFDSAKMTGSAGTEGITFSGTIGATVSNSTFRGMQVAVVLGSVTNGRATRDRIAGAVSDGIDIANSHRVAASYNTCSEGDPGPGAHPDCVQLWSVTGQPLQSQIVVRNNTAIGPTQGFTAFDSMGGEQQIQIIHNNVDTSFPQGVACYACVNSVISYNTVTTLPGARYQTSLNVIGGTGDTVIGNSVQHYVAPDFGNNSMGFDLPFAAEPSMEIPPDLTELVGTPLPGNSVAAIPEPSGWTLMVAGFAAAGVATRRRWKAPSPTEAFEPHPH